MLIDDCSTYNPEIVTAIPAEPGVYELYNEQIEPLFISSNGQIIPGPNYTGGVSVLWVLSSTNEEEWELELGCQVSWPEGVGAASGIPMLNIVTILNNNYVNGYDCVIVQPNAVQFISTRPDIEPIELEWGITNDIRKVRISKTVASVSICINDTMVGTVTGGFFPAGINFISMGVSGEYVSSRDGLAMDYILYSGVVELPKEQPSSYTPTSAIELWLAVGDSEYIPLGKFYADRIEWSTDDGVTKIEARNIIGKYLDGQTLNQNYRYDRQNLKTLIESLLKNAGITNFEVAETTLEAGYQWTPDTTYLQALEDVLSAAGWEMREVITYDGMTMINIVTVGPSVGAKGQYSFSRGRDLFTRSVIREETEAYAQVCAHTSDWSVIAYAVVPSTLSWAPPTGKTYFLDLPDGTKSYEAQSIALAKAAELANCGEVETYTGPFRPQIEPGDDAVLDEKTVGVVTSVTHRLGADGFVTELTIDSGGIVPRPKIGAQIQRLLKQKGKVSKL